MAIDSNIIINSLILEKYFFKFRSSVFDRTEIINDYQRLLFRMKILWMAKQRSPFDVPINFVIDFAATTPPPGRCYLSFPNVILCFTSFLERYQDSS